MEVKPLRLLKKQDDKPLEASKWIELPLLLSYDEMKKLIHSLETVYLCNISKTLTQLNSVGDFLDEYKTYIEALKSGNLPKSLQAYLLSATPDALYATEISSDRFLVRACLPAVFIRPHHFIFSPLDKRFRSKVYGENAISWGYTFSYPQYCINPDTHEADRVDEKYTNTALFKKIQKWVRDFTSPTPFLLDGDKINAPIRIGKGCLPFIRNHPQLLEQHLHVAP